MNKYAKQLFDLAYEASGGRPEYIDPEIKMKDLENRVKRCEELILMQVDINKQIVEILKID